MRIKRYKIDCEFHDRSPRSLPEVERRFTLPSRKVRQQCVSRCTRFPRRVPRRNETRISRTSCPLYARITWAVRSVNIHVKKTSVPLKVECKLIKRIKDSKSSKGCPLTRKHPIREVFRQLNKN